MLSPAASGCSPFARTCPVALLGSANASGDLPWGATTRSRGSPPGPSQPSTSWRSTRPLQARESACCRPGGESPTWRGARLSYALRGRCTGRSSTLVRSRMPVDRVTDPRDGGVLAHAELTEAEGRLLSDLFAIVEEHADSSAVTIDRDKVEKAFVYSCVHHADQRRRSGEEFIIHPVGVAKICAGMRLDTETLCAALLHDTVEDTSASLDEVQQAFGEEIAGLVDGVTKLTGLTFQSRDEAQAENYRKMMVAMASDIRVILIKLADRLHNMRTISAMPKQKQIEKARETLDIYAPIAHRLGIHAIKWELEDLAFQTLP